MILSHVHVSIFGCTQVASHMVFISCDCELDECILITYDIADNMPAAMQQQQQLQQQQQQHHQQQQQQQQAASSEQANGSATASNAMPASEAALGASTRRSQLPVSA
jgi:hypothetical protein